MSYTAPPRCPDDLLTSDLPDWAVRVWLAVRSVQGGNGEAWAFYDEYERRSRKSPGMVKKAIGLLKREGWLEETKPASRSNAPHLRCLWKRSEPHSDLGEKGRNPVPQKVGTPFPKGRNHIPTPNKEEPVQESVQEPEGRAREQGGTEPPSAPSGNGPTLNAVKARAAMAGVPEDQAEAFFWHYEESGWRTGGQNPRPIRNWVAALMKWHAKERGSERVREKQSTARRVSRLSVDPTAVLSAEDRDTLIAATPDLTREHFSAYGKDRFQNPQYRLKAEARRLVSA